MASYDALVAEPLTEIERLCAFLDVEWDDDLAEPLPDSRHTLDSPHPEKWRRNADELEPHVGLIAPTAARARQVFAETPRTSPVHVVLATDRAPRPSIAPADSDAIHSAEDLFGSEHTASFRALLDTTGSSLLVTTYQAGRLIMIRSDGTGINTHFRALPDTDGRRVPRTSTRHRHPVGDHDLPEPTRARTAARPPGPARRLLRGASTPLHG